MLLLRCSGALGLAPVRKGRPSPLEPAGSVGSTTACTSSRTQPGRCGVPLGHGGMVLGARRRRRPAPGGRPACRRPGRPRRARWRPASRRPTRRSASGTTPGPLRCRGAGAQKDAARTSQQADRGGGRAGAPSSGGTGKGLRAVARELGLDPSTVSPGAATRPAPAPQPSGALVPLAPPLPRTESATWPGRACSSAPSQLSPRGRRCLLPAPCSCCRPCCRPGSSTPSPRSTQAARAAFYSLRALVLTVVFTALSASYAPRGSAGSHPADIGRLIGLDRAPEVGTLRRRMEELASRGRSAELLRSLAKRHLDAD